jgi:hypothetical protein
VDVGCWGQKEVEGWVREMEVNMACWSLNLSALGRGSCGDFVQGCLDIEIGACKIFHLAINVSHGSPFPVTY